LSAYRGILEAGGGRAELNFSSPLQQPPLRPHQLQQQQQQQQQQQDTGGVPAFNPLGENPLLRALKPSPAGMQQQQQQQQQVSLSV